MDEAFALAERGRGLTHPNPLVGAVVVKDGAVVGRGFHAGPGEPHAEAVALREAGPAAAARRSTARSNRAAITGARRPAPTRSCAAGVARVVVACSDPNPLVDGRGFARLRAAGVAVDIGGGRWEPAPATQNAAFVKAVTTGLPLVTYKAAVTLDGKVAAAGGDARWISGPESRRRVHAMRAAADAVMIGAGTVRRDDPELTVRLVEGPRPGARRRLERRRAAARRHAGCARPAADADHRPRDARVVRRPAAALEERGVEVLEMGDGGLRRGLGLLAERGLLDILCEGGPGLAGVAARRRPRRPARRSSSRRCSSGAARPTSSPRPPCRRMADAPASRRTSAGRPSATTCCCARTCRRGAPAPATAPSARRARGRCGLMFTGLVEEVGTLRSLRVGAQSAVLEIAAGRCSEGLAVGDSMLTDGVCLTVTAVRARRLLGRRHARDGAPHDARRAACRATVSTSSARSRCRRASAVTWSADTSTASAWSGA